jgi:hypothetical protein
MIRSRQIFIALTMLAIIMIFCSAANFTSRRSSLHGRIVAYRLADRIFQVASSIENREHFLFQVEGLNEELVKLVYVHYGYSDIKDDVISGDVKIAIVAQRNRSCDETLDKFEKNAYLIPVEGEGHTIGEKIIFADEKYRQIPKSLHLKCYVLDHWEPIIR